jgi:high-affinity iron transporter
MRSGAPADEVKGQLAQVVRLLSAAAGRSESSFGALFVNSLLIILREGFEAILILSAVATTLRAGGNLSGLPPLRAGAILALLASLLLAAAASWIGGIGASGEAIEGITCLVAVVVLFFTSFWLISRAEGRKWQQFVRDRVNRAALGNHRGSLALLAFVVVFREGFETVLFYEALGGQASATPGGPWAVAAGFGSGSVLLVLMWAAIARFGIRIPMRSFFAVTGALLYVLAIKFAGVGIRELQEAGWVSPAPIAGMPEIAWLRDWLGVYPDVNTLALQGALVAAVVIGLAFSFLRGARGVRAEGRARHAA